MMKEMYANILFPLALDSEFTYRIPPELTPAAVPGKQVTAPVGNHIQTGIITHIFDVPHTLDVPPTLEKEPELPSVSDIKNILSIEEKLPVIPEKTLQFWHWIASYYL
jgi:primosomal protein N' (replication factor Y)